MATPAQTPTAPCLDDYGLDAEARAAHGIEDGWRFGVPGTVTWGDVDPFRHANHTSFLRWFENCRNVYLEAVGLPRLSADTPGPVMKRLETEYIRGLEYFDPFMITGRTVSMRRTSFVMEYAAWNDGCRCRCRAVLVLMINATGERAAIPDKVRAAITALDNPRIE
jgi:acyl-CoA thioester hydrolase